MPALGPVTLNILWFVSEFSELLGTLKYSKSTSFHVLSNPTFMIDLTVFVGGEEQGAMILRLWNVDNTLSTKFRVITKN
jgi:hypothetical protein